MINRRLNIFVILSTSLLLFACGSAPPEPSTMKAQIVAAKTLNPDRRGASKPVVVRLFQLKTAGSFEVADFFSLYRDADAVLGADLLATQEIMMQPGGIEILEAEFDPATRVIGVIAAFRDIENAQWRTSVELPDEKFIKFLDKRQMLVNLDDRTVTLQFAKPSK